MFTLKVIIKILDITHSQSKKYVASHIYVNVDHGVLVRSAFTPYMPGFICLAVIVNENTLMLTETPYLCRNTEHAVPIDDYSSLVMLLPLGL